MTLTNAIEAAKDSYGRCIQRLEDFKREFGGDPLTMAMIPHAKNCLDALPDAPMSEDEIILKIGHILEYNPANTAHLLAREVFKELKAANVLYVRED